TAGWLVGFSSALAARRVDVRGVRTLSPTDVRAAAQVPLGTPLARQDVDAIAGRVAGLKPVQRVQVTRQWPETIRITVQERTPVLAVRQPDGFLLVDATGYPYLTVTQVPADVVLADIDPGNPALLTEVGVVAHALPRVLKRKITHVGAYSADAIRLTLTDGDVVVWGSSDESPLKAQVLEALLKRKASSYDVSAPHSPATR
ncbi:MAG: cell division protein FtsQ, partial [Actinomycetota bacterium]|nr:cell division protein FtsQ [Actinomycetota bacterium]